MAAELKTRILLDLAGNYGAQMQAFDKLTAKFASGAQYSMGVAGRAWNVFGSGIDKVGNNFWARVAGAGGLALAGRQVAGFDESLTRIGINANASADQVKALKQQLFEIANRPDVNVKVDELAAGIAAIVEKTGDLKFAQANMLNLARFMQATGESSEDIGDLIGNIRTFGVEAPDQILKVVDAWTVMGKQSGVSLKSMIRNGQQIMSIYQQLGRTGPQALKEVGAVMSMTTKALGNPRRAVSDIMELLEAMNSSQSRPLMTYLGITDISGKMKVPLDDAMKRIVEFTHGSQAELQKLFGNTGSLVFGPLVAEFKSGKPMDAMQKYMNVVADGSDTIHDSARAAQEAAESVNKLYNSWEQFTNTNLSKDIKSIADGINSIDPATLQKWMKAGEYIAGGALAIYGTRKLWGLGKDALSVGRYIFTGGKSGGMAGKLGALGGVAGATPVFVVNMPGGGLAGGAGGALSEAEAAAGGTSKVARFLGAAGKVTAAGAAGYAIGTAIYDAIDTTTFADKIGSGSSTRTRTRTSTCGSPSTPRATRC